MSLNSTPHAERIQIGFFGMRNAGKSSLMNALTGQEIAVVSSVKGTTTDPVKKAMELLPLGAVLLVDTPGLDDEGELGAMRMEKTQKILAQTDIAILVVDASVGLSEADEALRSLLRERNLPYILVWNKMDLLDTPISCGEGEISVSTQTKEGISTLKEMLGAYGERQEKQKYIVSDLLEKGDMVVLVIPIDESAPKGRLILPQQQTIRDILDAGCIALSCQPEALADTLAALKENPKLVITDSQAFGQVAKILPAEIPLTSFSILFARYKGELAALVESAQALSRLQDGDTVLISEGCTHHRQCGDIGTVKIPKWLEDFSGRKLQYTFTSGSDFPKDLGQYALIIHCGACMLPNKEMAYRMEIAKNCGVPMINYGAAIAQLHGILQRSLEIFPHMAERLSEIK